MIGASCLKPLHQALIPLAATVPPAALFISGKTRHFHLEEEVDTKPAVERERPPSIDFLLVTTKFSRSEIQHLYRTFKDFFPTGIVTLEDFQLLYSQIFPKGNVKTYSELLFKNIDQHKKGTITFLDFITSFSKVAKGTLSEKIDWIFSMYDVKGTGKIDYSDIYSVVFSLYRLADSRLKPSAISTICRQHVKVVYQKLNIEMGLQISFLEFSTKCMENKDIMNSFEILGSFPNGFINLV